MKGVGKKRNNRGQVTIFIIIAIVVVGVALLIYFFAPGIRTGSESDLQNPSSFIQTCLENDLEETVDLVSLQGGNLEPEFYYLYQSVEVSYLCYTSENGAFCNVQQPLLKAHIEEEIHGGIQSQVSTCFDQLEQSYINRGYDVNLERGTYDIELLPNRIEANFDYILTLTRGETQRYEVFNIVLNNNLYELVNIANSIVSLESVYGESDTNIYMNYYRDLKVEKREFTDGTKVYILTHTDTGNKFQFASRSRVLSPGFV